MDDQGNVWVAHSLLGSTTVGHLRTDGTFVGNVDLPGGSGPTGVAVDINGKVWVANIYSDNAMRIDPSAGSIGGGGYHVGAVDMVVNLGPGAGPYNYSDMTGFVELGSTAARGTWTVTHDSRQAGTQWDKISWTAIEPGGTRLVVEARAADNLGGLAAQPYQVFPNALAACSLAVSGRFIQIRATFSRDIGVSETPVLKELSVECFAGIAPGNLQFSAAHYNVNEGSGAITIEVKRACGSAGQVAVNFSTSNGTATEPDDYSATSGTLVFEDGELSKSFTIPIVDDGFYEEDESINLSLSTPTGGAALATPSSAVVSIQENDNPPSLAIDSILVGEGKSSATVASLTVSLSAPSGRTTTVDFGTVDGTAIAGEDYVATNGTLVFKPGETVKTIAVQIIGDSIKEPDETFTISLLNPTNATIAAGEGTCTILDDDQLDQMPVLAFQRMTFSDSGRRHNGIIEPGESVTLEVVLANKGPVAAGAVSANLGTITAGIIITHSDSAYGNIPILDSRTNAVSYEFTVDGSIACGTSIDLTLRVTNRAGVADFPFQLVVGSVRAFYDNMEFGSASWSHSATGLDTWSVLSDPNALTPFRVWHAEAVDTISEQTLMLKPITIPLGSNQRLRFWHTYAFERGFDGGIIEISTDGGAGYTDLGPLILTGGYDGTISTSYGNPIAGRSAWTGGNIGPMTEVTVDLSAYAGQEVRIRWRLGTDSSVARPGWSIDEVMITADTDCRPGDLDSVGDGIPDWWRARYFGGDGTTTNNQSCATCDADGDGGTNWQEFQAGTSPTESASALRIVSIESSGNDIRVTWTAIGGKTYILQAKSDGIDGSFAGPFSDLPMEPIVVPGSGETIADYLDSGAAAAAHAQYYRVRLVP